MESRLNEFSDGSILALKAGVAAIVSYWFGLGAAMQTLLGLMALDIVTGIVAGFAHQQLNSKTASKGITRKAGSLIIIFAVHLVSDQASDHLGMPMPDLGNVTAWFYVLTEWISITENCARLGAPIPKKLLDALKAARRFQEAETAIADVQDNQAAAQESLDKAQKATEVLKQSLPMEKDSEQITPHF